MTDSLPGLECPSTEALAIYVDGRVSETERQRIVSHVARCEDCYSVLSETLRFVHREPPHRLRRLKSSSYIVLASAAVLLVALFGRQFRTSVEPGTALLATLSYGELTEAWDTHAWSTLRGGAPLLSDRTRAFRTGVLLLDLRVALRGELPGHSQRSLQRLRDLVPDDGPSAALLSYSRSLREAIEQRSPLSSTEGRLDELESELEEAMTTESLVAFGRWAEAGRLAAITGDDRYVRSRAFREGLRQAQDQTLPRSLSASLSRIEELTGDELTEAKLRELETLFTTLVGAAAL